MSNNITGFIIVHGDNINFSYRSIGSILSQSITPDYLKIVVTDNIEDNYKTLSNLFSNKKINNCYVEVIKSNKKLSCGESKRFCADLCGTTYFFTLDSDDYFSHKYIEYALPFIKEKYNLISSDYITVQPNNKHIENTFFQTSIYKQNIYHCASIVNKEAYEKVGGYDINYAYEDWQLWIKLTKLDPSKCIKIPHYLFYYIKHNNNISNKFNIVEEFNKINKFVKSILGE